MSLLPAGLWGQGTQGHVGARGQWVGSWGLGWLQHGCVPTNLQGLQHTLLLLLWLLVQALHGPSVSHAVVPPDLPMRQALSSIWLRDLCGQDLGAQAL